MNAKQARIPVYAPPELAKRLAALARENERSVAAEARLAIRRHLEAAACGSTTRNAA